jgi:hypothetical protein
LGWFGGNAVGVTDRPGEMAELVAVIEKAEGPPKARGAFRRDIAK